MPTIDAFVFDAYGTLFDVHSVTALAESLWPGHGASISQRWRAKQLEYSWLTSLMNAEAGMDADFGTITAAALDHAFESLRITAPADARQSLLDGYHRLAPFPDALPTLAALAPRPRWILSNGSHAMLDPLVGRSALAEHLDGVLTVEKARAFKPHPRVYRLATERLRLPASRIGFVSSNCWDAVGAAAFGFTAFWINRSDAPLDRHGPVPYRILHSLQDLPRLAEAQ
jgi:2-haloacid dehalogenase